MSKIVLPEEKLVPLVIKVYDGIWSTCIAIEDSFNVASEMSYKMCFSSSSGLQSRWYRRQNRLAVKSVWTGRYLPQILRGIPHRCIFESRSFSESKNLDGVLASFGLQNVA